MRGTDKYLIVFGIGIVALVVIALAVAARQPAQTYMEGDGPEAVAHNYLLALEKGDYERAYSYLSPDLKGYPPDVPSFVRQINRDRYQFPLDDNPVAFAVASVRQGEDWAEAEVRMTVTYGSGLFGPERYTDEFQLVLGPSDDGWKIVDGERLFARCWSSGKCD